MTTLYSFLKAIPELGGRVFWDGTAPSTPATPYALLWDKPGGPVSPYGKSDVMQLYPCVIVYDKAATNEAPVAARLRLQAIADKLQGAVYAVDTHSDGIKPYLNGSVYRVNEPTPTADSTVAGQSKLFMQFSAQLYRD